jgi:hypothetical protein
MEFAHQPSNNDVHDRPGLKANRKLMQAAIKLSSVTKRGYSRDFKPHGDTGRRYLLDKIPAGLWTAANAKAKREGESMRGLILRLLKEWLTHER